MTLCHFSFRCYGANSVDLVFRDLELRRTMHSTPRGFGASVDLPTGVHIYRFEVNQHWVLSDQRGSGFIESESSIWSVLFVDEEDGPCWRDLRSPRISQGYITPSESVDTRCEVNVSALLERVNPPGLLQVLIQDPDGRLVTASEGLLLQDRVDSDFCCPVDILVPPPPSGWKPGKWRIVLRISESRECSFEFLFRQPVRGE